MGLNAAQKAAVEYLEGPLLVLAGPGTGKTQLLSEKVAYILANTDTNPENILCLTFTESGADNMCERLRSLIKSDALKVNIYTYHAFGSEILAQYKNYSADFERGLDEAIDEVRQYKIVKAIQDALPPRDILRGDSVKDIISVISEAKAAGLTADDLATIAEQNREDGKVLSESISPLLLNVVPRNYEKSLSGAYQPIFTLLSNYRELPPIMGRIERSIVGLARDLSVAMEEAAASGSVKPLSRWKDNYFEKDEAGNYRLKDRVANLKLASLARVMADYDRYLREQKLYDFDDMIEEALHALQTDEGFRLTLEERYQYIMLDEFQDTNPSQFAIVKALTDYEKPNVMAVGDDDQAIYEFQGALASNLTDFREHYNAEVITLTENYRSTQEILDFARQIINQAPDRFADKELVAHKPTPVTSQIHRVEFAGADAEYAFVADKIAELIHAGVRQSDIAVISYKTKYFEPLLPYLKAHSDIKIAYEKRDNLLENQRIHEILTILRYVDDLAHERRPSVQLLEILTYPYFELPILEIMQLSNQARADHQSLFEALSTADAAVFASAEKFHAAAESLGKLIAASFVEPLDFVINELMQKMQPLASNAETFAFYENVAALIGLVKKHVGDKPLKVADLLAMVDDYEAAEMTLIARSPYREANDAVQILTAHKAKGLEFSYVFIITADHTAWGKGKGNNNLLSLPKNLTQIRHTGITDSERLRVLYVALTRAKNALYITNALHDFSDKSPERLEYLSEYVEKDGENETIVSPYLPSKVVEQRYDVAPEKVRTANLQNWLAAYRANTPELRALYQTRVAHWRMSASALTTFIDIAYAGPEAFFKSYVLRAPREPANEAMARGNLIHATFEAVTSQGLSDAQAIEFYMNEIDKQDLPSELAARIKNEGAAWTMPALRSFGDILRGGEAEVDLASEQLVVNGIPVTGKLDHITIDETAKAIEIYDFKTGGYHKENWGSHLTLYKYMLQLEFYRLLLMNSKKYSKYHVTRAHILFVTPDPKNNDAVYDKVYEFNTEAEQELLALMRAVYNEVTTLSFLDDSVLMLSADPNRSLKDIKEFVKLLIDKAQGE